MRILLTGSTGLVGRNFLEHPDIGRFDLLLPTHSELNLLDYSAIRNYLFTQEPDLVIHAAGTVGGIQANMREPVRFLLENLDMGRNLVWAARQTGVKRLINLGSSCMYPAKAPNPLCEKLIMTGELEPTNEGYALAKITVARLCEYITREDPEYQYKTLVPCNLYGRWDKFDPVHSHLIAAIIHKVHQAKLAGRAEVEIWGDGTVRREFMYAGDLADCLVEGVRQFDTMPLLMNVGQGRDYTVSAYYRTVAEVIGYRGRFVHDLSKPVGMKQKIVAIDRLSGWGWQSKVSLHEGLVATYNYYLQKYDKGEIDTL
jgi:GDP-L-fucose synthase